MKRILSSFLFLVISISFAKADDVSFTYLLGTDSVNVNLDFSRLKMPKNMEGDFSELIEIYGDYWKNNFIKEMNEPNKRWHLTFGTYKSRYTILIQFISVESNASLKAMFRVIDLYTVSELYAQLVICRGGLFGDFDELLDESMRRMGEEIGDIIKDNMEEREDL